jgi:hypothetical protein
MISKNEVLMGRDKTYPQDYTKEISDNIDKMLIVLNKIRSAYGKPMTVSSGWRPAAVNSKLANAGKKSNHMLGLACDFKDADGQLKDWVIANLKLMADLGVYIEDFNYTKGWVHFQIVPPKSKKRVFIPSASPAPWPNQWDGKYDQSLDR